MEALRIYLELTSQSQKEMADKLGVKQPTVSGWLSGKYKPSAEMLKRISFETGISIDKLLSDMKAA